MTKCSTKVSAASGGGESLASGAGCGEPTADGAQEAEEDAPAYYLCGIRNQMIGRDDKSERRRILQLVEESHGSSGRISGVIADKQKNT